MQILCSLNSAFADGDENHRNTKIQFHINVHNRKTRRSLSESRSEFLSKKNIWITFASLTLFNFPKLLNIIFHDSSRIFDCVSKNKEKLHVEGKKNERLGVHTKERKKERKMIYRKKKKKKKEKLIVWDKRKKERKKERKRLLVVTKKEIDRLIEVKGFR